MVTVEISTLQELQAINDYLSGDYVLVNIIDAIATASWNQLNWRGTWQSSTTYNENDYIEESGNYYYQLQDSYTSGTSFDFNQWIQTTNFTGGSADDGTALGFRPLGNRNEAYTDLGEFTGSFDGQNHTITGLYINRGQENNAGLFGFTDGSTIENISLEDVDVSKGSGSDFYRGMGGLVGNNYDGSKVSNSYATGTVSGGDYNTGGMVGYNVGSTVSNSYATGDVSGSNNVGGLVGYNRYSTVSNSYSTGDVSGSDYVGGLVGQNRYSTTVQNSYATGDVSGSGRVGGLVGRVYNNEEDTDEILYSYANSDINPDLDLIGADDTSGTLDTTGSSLKTTAEMTDYPSYSGVYVDWTFTEA